MKCCEAVKRSCAEKLVLYLIIIMTNIKLFLVYKDQRSPEKKTRKRNLLYKWEKFKAKVQIFSMVDNFFKKCSKCE